MSEFNFGGRLQDKVAIVTGAGGGIGGYTARLFAAHGAKVVVTDINQTAIDSTLALIKEDGNGNNAIGITLDVSSEADWAKVVSFTVSKFGKLTTLVNNAGYHLFTLLPDMSYAEWTQHLKVNLDGVFIGIQTAVPELLKTGNASIVNIASIAGLISGSPAHYATAKSGVISLSRVVAGEYGKKGIRVNSLCPGLIRTNFTKEALETPEITAMLAGANILPFFGEPRDIAYGILFLASDEARYVTGSNMVIDGGVTAK